METEDFELYTSFPDFGVTVPSTEAEEHHPTTVSVTDFEISEDSLILSWAALLQSFTEASEPIFPFNGTPVKVNLSQKSWESVKIRDSRRQATHTAVSLDSVSNILMSFTYLFIVSCNIRWIRLAQALFRYHAAPKERLLPCFLLQGFHNGSLLSLPNNFRLISSSSRICILDWVLSMTCPSPSCQSSTHLRCN